MPGQPLVHIGNDVKHVNHTDFLSRSVLFRDVGADNWEQVLEECEQGGFGVLMSTWTEPGDFHTPWRHVGNPARTPFSDFNALKQACAAFRAAGIELQWHGYFNNVTPEGGSLLGFNDRGNPPQDWIDFVETVPVGKLIHNVSATDSQFALDQPIEDNPDWQHIAIENKGVKTWGTPWHYSIYAIGREIVYCYNQFVDGQVMARVVRGGYKTTPQPHNEGTPVALLLYRNGYFLKADSDKQSEAVALFADAYEQLGMSAVYCDGWSGPNLPDEDVGASAEGMFNRYIKPYADAVDGLVQFGGRVPAAAGDRCRLGALGDAWWLHTVCGGNVTEYVAKYQDIRSRRLATVPHQAQNGWLPLDGTTSPKSLELMMNGGPYCFQVLPTANGVDGWDTKPQGEREALLALIKQLNEGQR